MKRRNAPLAALLAGLLLLAGAISAEAASAEPDCPAAMRCLKVPVPLDRTGVVPGTIDIPVVVQQGEGPVLLLLAGGPGQGFVADGPRYIEYLAQYVPGHRIAVLDQRGTGSIALRCPSLQRLPLSDLFVPPAKAVKACGRLLGAHRAFYSTTDTVEDLDAVRAALGVDRMSMMGISYGTYVAERYATAHPDRVEKLILDSVVPQRAPDPFFRANFRRAGFVLRKSCAKYGCRTVTGDPARDLARLVRSRPYTGRVPGKSLRIRVDGPAIFDWITSVSSFEPKGLRGFQKAIYRTLRGDRGAMLSLGYEARSLSPVTSAESLSWGLHTATLCADMSMPFSIGSPHKGRRAAVKAAVAKLRPSELYPFDRRTAAGNGALVTCRNWPATVVEPPPAPVDLPAVPVLLFAGMFDLSTPLAEARRELARAPRGKLVVLPGGHGASIGDPCGLRAITRFMAGRLGSVRCVGAKQR